ncbi:MAG: 2-oxoacid:acceptor oxidoreductase family protein [Gemmataceae bacterium]|nr:2-oxoacid:acceptor oxidoreductase family protein [Gemmataceae bacterium]
MSTTTVQKVDRIPQEAAVEQKFQYPGIPTTCDGAEAVVHVEINVAQAAGAYPITSSTTMGGGFNAAVMNGGKNLWGDSLLFFEPESEHSAATVCEGFAVAGGRVTNFTSGQGLILMKEVLYTIAGKRLPVLMNIGARALTSQGLNVHAGHDDMMSVADCGWGMLFGRNAQEAGDLCLICRRAAEASATPFFNVQDGFLTTHTVESVRLPETEFMKEYIGDPKKLVNLMDTANPMMSGVVQNQDSYMKGKIAQRWYYDRVEGILEECFELFYQKTGRRYGFVEPYRCEDAEFILVGMGSYMETAKVTVDYLREKKGIPAGCLNVCVFRPFPARQIVDALKNCTAFTVYERMDDPMSTTGNHLTREIKAAFCDATLGVNGQEKIDQIPRIYHGAAGLGSRDVRPGDIIATCQNMMKPDGQHYFCVGIDHALALKQSEDPDLRPKGGFSMRGHSVGGFGSVTTNKVIATIAGNVFGKDVQAYPKYGSEKKGLPTTYYLTIGDSHIYMHSELEHIDLLCINDPTAIMNPLTLDGLQQNGAVFMQSPYAEPEEVWKRVPAEVKKRIRDRNIRVFFCDMVKIAREVASEADLQMRMQGIVLLGAFLKLTPYAKDSDSSDEQVYAGVEKALRKYFGKRGDQVVQDNLNCVKRGYNEMKEIPKQTMQAV